MRERSQVPLLLLVGAAVVAGGVMLAAAWASASEPPQRGDLVTAAMIIPVIALGRIFPLQIAFRRQMVTDTAPLFAAALLLPPPLAASAALAAIVPAEIYSGLRGQFFLRQVLFNSCQAMVGVFVASLVSHLAPQDLGQALSTPAGLAAMLGAAGAMLCANDVLVFSVVWAQLGLRFHRMLWDYARGRTDIPYDLALLGIGGVAAVFAQEAIGALWLLALPVPLLHRAMKNQIALRVQTRDAVIALADAVDDRDPYTFGHCRRVAIFSEGICREMGLSRDLTEEIILAARVHDVGKIGIRDSVLQKPARLTEEEFAHIKEHPDIGARLTARFPDFGHGTRYIRHHHERWDGGGYPAGLKGKSIPMGARIIAVADTYDAITSSRVYRDGLDDEFARLEMARVSGTQLDPEVVLAWFRVKDWGSPAQERAATIGSTAA